MMSKYSNKERKGLPGGPNEMFSYTTGVFSQTPSWFSNGPSMFAQTGTETKKYLPKAQQGIPFEDVYFTGDNDPFEKRNPREVLNKLNLNSLHPGRETYTDANIEAQRQEALDWINSPGFLKVAGKSYSNPELEQRKRAATVKNTPYELVDKIGNKRGFVNGLYDWDEQKILLENSGYKGIPLEEFNHSSVYDGEKIRLSARELNGINRSIKDGVSDYYKDPAEVQNRVMLLRKVLKDNNVYDYNKDTFNTIHLKKLKEEINKHPEKFKYGQIKDLLKSVKTDADLIWLMNNLTSIEEDDGTRMAQKGSETKKYLKRAQRGGIMYDEEGMPMYDGNNSTSKKTVPTRKGVRKNPDGSHSTHLMAREYIPERGWVVFPTLFQNEDGSWLELSTENGWYDAYQEAIKRDEVIDFGEDEEGAINYADKGAWKKDYKIAEPSDSIKTRKLKGYQDGAEVIPPYNYIDRDFGKRFGNDASILEYSNNAGVFLGENLPEAQKGKETTPQDSSWISESDPRYAKLYYQNKVASPWYTTDDQGNEQLTLIPRDLAMPQNIEVTETAPYWLTYKKQLERELDPGLANRSNIINKKVAEKIKEQHGISNAYDKSEISKINNLTNKERELLSVLPKFKNISKENFSDTYSAARKAGQKEFTWMGEIYSTNYYGTPRQQLKETGITNDRLGIRTNRSDRAYNTVKPSSYDEPHLKQQIKNFYDNRNRFDDSEYHKLSKELKHFDEKGDLDKVNEILTKLESYNDNYFGKDDLYSENAWQIYLGIPQEDGVFNISKYQPSNSKDKNVNYYSLPNEFKDELFNLYSTGKIKKGLNNEFSFESHFGENASRARVLGNFTVDEGKDEKGDYISYYDIYDLEPNLPGIGKYKISNFVGKPFEIYDRIYYKDYGDGQKKQMHYSDKELLELDVNKKNFNTLSLQKELSNRGYKLPKSIKKDGSFDGIFGDEVKQALLDWQSKNNKKRGGEKRLQRIGMSRDGYKRYSPDVNNPYNIIPSGNITMEDVDFPILGIDNYGNEQVMIPGDNYTFPGDTVLEFPIAQRGAETGSYDYSKNLDFETMQQYIKDVGMPQAWSQFNNAEKALYRQVMRQFNFKGQPVDVYNPNGVNAEYYTDADGERLIQSAPIPSGSIEYEDGVATPIDTGVYIKEWNDSNESRPKNKGMAADWDKRRDEYVVSRILEDNPTLLERDVEAMNKLSMNAQKFLSADPRFQQSYWQDMKDGLYAYGASVHGMNNPLLQRIPQILDDPNKTNYEKQQLVTQYLNSPKLSALGEVATGAFAPYEFGTKLAQGLYKPDYSLDDALAGKRTQTEDYEQGLYDVGLGLATLGTGPIAKAGVKKAIKKLKNADNFRSSVLKNNINESRFDHDVRINKDLRWFRKEDGSSIPFNEKTGKSLQQEYIEDIKAYYDSPEFNRIMKEEYPDVDVEKYKQATLENLEKEITFNIEKQTPRSLGIYYPKDSNDIVYASRPSFRQRVNNANLKKDIPEGEGQSYLRNMIATDHELSHQRTNGKELLPDYLTKNYLWENVKPSIKNSPTSEGSGAVKASSYYLRPSEFEVRLRQLKKDLKREGIVDYFQNPIEEHHIQSLLDKDNVNISGDTKDLLQRWDIKFLAEQAKKLPQLALPITGAGALQMFNDSYEESSNRPPSERIGLPAYQQRGETPKYDFTELAERLNNSYDPQYGWDYSVLTKDELKFYTDYYNKNIRKVDGESATGNSSRIDITQSEPETDLLYNTNQIQNLPLVTVTATRMKAAKHAADYEKKNPKPKRKQTLESTNWRKAMGLKDYDLIEWEKDRNRYVANQVAEDTGITERDVEAMNQITPLEEEYLLTQNKYQPSLYQDFTEGLETIGTGLSSLSNPYLAAQPFSQRRAAQIMNSDNLTEREKQSKAAGYLSNPGISAFGDAMGVLSPLDVGVKALQAPFVDDYTIGDALSGTRNDVNPAIDMLMGTVTGAAGAKLAGKMARGISKSINASPPIKEAANFNPSLISQSDAVKARAERMLSQQNKWREQNNIKLQNQFENAANNHVSDMTARDFNIAYNKNASPANLGMQLDGKTFVYKDAPLTEANKARVAAHETGHFYRNAQNEADEWANLFDFSGLNHRTKTYLRGKGLTGRGKIKADEIRERAAQLKDYIAQKNNIPLNEDFIITQAQLDDAIKNYVKDTGLDNQMTPFLNSIKDKEGLLKMMNKSALTVPPAIIGTGIYLQSQQDDGYQEGGSVDTFRGSIYDQPIGTSRRMLKQRGGEVKLFKYQQPFKGTTYTSPYDIF